MKEEKIEISRLIVLLKKQQFPRVGKDFYIKFRERIREIDEAMGNIRYPEEKKELEEEKKNLMYYGERIYRRRMKSLLIEISKKVVGGKVNILNFTEEEMEIYNQILTLIDKKREELLEGKVDILDEKFSGFEVVGESEDESEEEENIMSEEDVEHENQKSQEVESERATEISEEIQSTIEVEEESREKMPDESVKEEYIEQIQDVIENEKQDERPEEAKIEEKATVERRVTIPVRMLSAKPFVGLDGHYYYPEKGDILNLDEKVAKILIEGRYAERIDVR